MNEDKQIELVNDVVSSEKMSDCCSAAVYAPSDNWAICMDCKEHCDVVYPEDLEFADRAEQDKQDFFDGSRGV